MDAPKVVYIAWLDIYTNHGPWVNFDERTTPAECYSVGFLVHESDNHLEISSSYSDGDTTREALVVTSIPRSCITKLEYLTLDNLRAQFAD